MNQSISAIDHRKSVLREQARTVRAQARARSAESAFQQGAQNFLDAVGIVSGRTIAGYWPIGDEFDTRPLLMQIANRGGDIVLPVISASDTRLSFRSWRPGAPMKPAKFGTLEPAAGVESADPAILIVPLLAFDRRGNRLGYGGGYYDRTLAALRRTDRFELAIGMAFSAQRVARVPTAPNDQTVDALVTEDGVIWTGKQPPGAG